MPDVGTRRLRVALLGLLVVLLVAAALVGLWLREPSADEPAPDPAPAGAGLVEVDLGATLELPRLVRDPRTVAVLVTNHAAEPVRVREVELLTESFAPTGPVDKDVLIPGGGAKALSVVYGEARCGGEAAPALAPVSARLVVAGAEPSPDRDGWQTVELPLAKAADRLTLRLHTDCAAQVVAGSVRFGLDDWQELPDGRLRGVLVVERLGGDEPITVHRVTGSVLYEITAEPPEQRPSRPPPASQEASQPDAIGFLPAGEDRLEVPVIADAARCDPHAKADAKQPFRFQTWATISTAEQLPATVGTDRAGQDQLSRMWDLRCGF